MTEIDMMVCNKLNIKDMSTTVMVASGMIVS
jgi:hypothetical protein